MKYYIHTFGCQQNKADSERIARDFKSRGMTAAKNYQEADYIIINTCMIRESAENRVYGLVNNLKSLNRRIVVTGCMAGMALKDRTGEFMKLLKKRLPGVDEFLAIEEIRLDNIHLKTDKYTAYVPISNGCNNFCSYCVVPYARGREVSRPYENIINECLRLKKKGLKNITLLGQNVNSYGSDLIKDLKNKNYKPIYIKHLGKNRIPTLFPYLLEEVAKMDFEKVDFISSNPWDFSDELIDVIARNKNITRTIHLPVQSGDDNVLRRMNRWYTHNEYLNLVANLKFKIKNLKLTTDIIVGFCGETEEEFENTVKLAKTAGFEKTYVSMYSERPMTAATKVFKDDVPYAVKKQRWQILENLINKPNLLKN